MAGPRLAVRALIVEDGKLLLVNAYKAGLSDLWCAPGGGAELHESLPANLAREVFEETGLTIAVGSLALVNEFHSPEKGFHQVEMFFRATITGGALDPAWRDTDEIVSERRFFGRDELAGIRFKPDSLADIAFGPPGEAKYDSLELLVR